MNQKPFIILSQLRENCTTTAQSTPPPLATQNSGGSKLFKAQKPQIASIPGISPREKNRYRVMQGEATLGDNLTIDEAIALAGGAR